MNKMIVAKAMSENKASIRVMEKAGLNFAEEFWEDYEPHSENPDVRYELKQRK
jgi:RimJ/RimL family protein N-acetyltransferase